MSTYKVVGKPEKRNDAFAKSSGEALFASDIEIPNMLHAKVLRSPHPHARIASIDTSEAEKIEGVKGIAHYWNTTQNLYNGAAPMFTTGPQQERILDQRVFDNVVRYVGDEVAAVAATTEAIAAEAVKAIKVEYEILPFVLNAHEAIKADAPALHAEKNVTHGGHNIPGDIIHLKWGEGEIEDAFKECDVIVEGTYELPIIKQMQMETHCAVAKVGKDGKVTVWSTSQTPHPSRYILAYTFGIPASKVRVLAPPYVGGGFGVRIGLSGKAEPIALALALLTKYPVRCLYSRKEDMIASDTRHAATVKLKLGAKKDGTFHALDMQGLFNTGAYCTFGLELPAVSGAMTMAIYNFKHSNYTGHSVYSNITPAGAMRGFGNPQGNLALERSVDILAEKLGIDPLVLREKNAMKANEPWFLPYPCSSSELRACMTQGAEAIGWNKRNTFDNSGIVKRGLGMAIGTHVSNAWPFCVDFNNAYVTVQVDGSIQVSSGVPDIGTGTSTSIPMIAAEAFGVSLDKVSFTFGDTESTPFDIGSHATRTLYSAGLAVKAAAEQARDKVVSYAAEVGKLNKDDIVIDNHIIGLANEKAGTSKEFEAGTAKAINLADLCYHAHIRNMQFIGLGQIVPPNSPPWHCVFADVSVDTETGQIQVNKIVGAHDVGLAINPQIVEGQIEGALVQGLGYALNEEITYSEKGVQQHSSMHNYLIPTACDVAEVQAIIVESSDPSGPFGAKGVGECGLVCPASAIANAVSNAIGKPINQIPMNPERLYFIINS